MLHAVKQVYGHFPLDISPPGHTTRHFVARICMVRTSKVYVTECCVLAKIFHI